MFKRIINVVAACALAIVSLHATEGMRSMTISLADNTTMQINLSADLVTSFTDDNLSITGDETNVLVALSDVLSRTYSTEKYADVIDIATGINDINFKQDASSITVSNMPEGARVALYSINGVLIKEFVGGDSTVVALDELPRGVYILSVNNQSIKFAK